jgi:hypothetical protein
MSVPRPPLAELSRSQRFNKMVPRIETRVTRAGPSRLVQAVGAFPVSWISRARLL